jgi:cytidyltransferase-like protein
MKIYDNASDVKASIPVGETITLVGGSLDLLHVGHLELLEKSKQLGGLLVVCVQSDLNVRSYKGDLRPIISEKYRARMVAALRCVDRVYISDVGMSHKDTLTVLLPDRVVYGVEDSHEWKSKQSERECRLKLYSPHSKIHYVERFPDDDVSTTAIVERITKLHIEK